MRKMARLLFGLLSLLAFAQPSEARRFFLPIPIFGRGETIDLVYDLPNEAPYVNNGDFVDVGFLNGRVKSGYVLYHGDRYRTLDDEDIAELTRILGFDPTAKHRAQYALDHSYEIAQAKAEKAHHDDQIARGLMIEPRPGESHEDYIVRRTAFLARARAESAARSAARSKAAPPPSPAGDSSGFGGFGITALVVIGLVVFRRRLSRAIFGSRLVSPKTSDMRGGEADVSHLSFDERVARRLAEMQGASPAGETAGITARGHHHAIPTPHSAARGFGRRPV